MPDGDILRILRAFDTELAAAAPSRQLEARLSARLRAAGTRRWPPGGRLVRIGWPIGLTAAVAGAALLFHREHPAYTAPQACDVPRGDPMEIVRDRDRADGGPEERDPRRAPPRIHAPSIDRGPSVWDPTEAPAAP
ncbi:Hypothetical protein A7982_00331 [Minicystis rosea]|nr:Hypothetical protein A7982_00331 [Minicystis rosea]